MKLTRREFVEAGLAVAGGRSLAIAARDGLRKASDGKQKPPRRVISASSPLIVVEGGIAAWELLPEEFRTHCALQFQGGTGIGSKGSPPSLFSNLERARAKNIPVILSVQGDEADSPPTRIAAVEKALEEFPNLIGLRCCELSCGPGLTPSERSHLLDFIELCGHYRALITWQDMGYPYQREHIFMRAGRDPQLFRALQKHGDLFILTDKMNGWGKYFETASLVLGMWACGIVAHWGFNVEDWWWFEQGYGKRFVPSKGRRGYARQHGKGYAATRGWDFASAVSCPDIFYAQNLLWAIAGGATVYSFEMPTHAFACADRTGAYRLTPAWKNAIYPLLKTVIDKKLIPSRSQALARMKVAYQDSGQPGTELDTPGEKLYRPLYGTRETDQQILARDLSSAIIPRSGRYYFLPVIPKLAPEKTHARFEHIIHPHQFANGREQRAYFDRIYPAESSGAALAIHINHAWFVTNWHENQDVAQEFSFRVSIAGRPVELAGTLRPNSMVLVTQRPRHVSLLVNNYLVNTHIWDKPLPEYFNAQRYLENYVTHPDDKEERLTTLQFTAVGEGKLSLSHRTRHGTVKSKWDPAAKALNVTLHHNGPVYLTLTL